MAGTATTFIVLPLGSKGRINIKGNSMTKDEDGVTIFDEANNAVALFLYLLYARGGENLSVR